MIEAEKRIREALADEALHDEGASVSDTLYAAHVFEEVCSPENIAALLADRDEREASLTRERDEARAERDALKEALTFYAKGEHFILGDADAWDTVSDEPQNYWCDEAGTATVEDGEFARAALAQIEQERRPQAKEG